ncbi:GATA-type zinc finger protein 1 isoform X1 [Pristis pectinata]|uniref:GATA-type zinc finger protein 1 isoform X1 n=1 Tax=Pristis pectinata TaxID=685728 RepID=UPI00223DA622|nr:GATA-type zinc finger protein 1 isoform X1 [Pristis pectinata]
MGSGLTPDPQEGGNSPRTVIIHPAPDSQEGSHSPRRVTLPPGLWAEGLMGADEVSEDPPPVPAAFGGASVPTSAAAADSVAADVQREGVGRFGDKGQDGADHCLVQHLVSPPDPHTHPLSLVRTRTPRKQPHPQRSAQSGDPSFEGVTVCMERELVGPLDCRLHITAQYSPGLQQKLTRFRSHRETTLTSHLSSSEEDPCPGHERTRRCASCGTQRTPLWRDAEDGTPLCNACGIRYKKYRIRCPKCWHIPKKEGKCFVRCLRCGDPLRLLMNARKGASC